MNLRLFFKRLFCDHEKKNLITTEGFIRQCVKCGKKKVEVSLKDLSIAYSGDCEICKEFIENLQEYQKELVSRE